MGCLRLTYWQKSLGLKVEKGNLNPLSNSSAGVYRYGFNGHEKDDEIKGSGNSYDLGFRHYDVRTGRMFSIDPRSAEYPWQTTYAYHRNSPIKTIDYLGGGSDDYVEGADGKITWRDDVTSKDDEDLKGDETYRGKNYTRYENITETTYSEVKYTTKNRYAYTIRGTPYTTGETEHYVKTRKNLARPDADGYVSIEEVNDWWHYANSYVNATSVHHLYIDPSKYDFKSSILSVENFSDEGDEKLVNFFYLDIHPSLLFDPGYLSRPAFDNDVAFIFGTVGVTLIDKKKGLIQLGDENGFIDTYDFNKADKPFAKALRSYGNPVDFKFYVKPNSGLGKIWVDIPWYMK